MKNLRSTKDTTGILAKRRVGDSVQYFIKWSYQFDQPYSWINQDCPQIDKYIDDFEKQSKISIDFDLNERDKIAVQMAHLDSNQQQLIDLINSNCFATKLRVDRVLNAVRHENQVLYLVKWMDSDLCDFVHAEQLRTLYPQTLIHFFEKKLKRQLRQQQQQQQAQQKRTQKQKNRVKIRRLPRHEIANDSDDNAMLDDDCIDRLDDCFTDTSSDSDSDFN